MREDAPQREHPLREVFNGLRHVVRGGISWRMIPNDLPPWDTVYQQTQRWMKNGVFEQMVHDFRAIVRVLEGKSALPSTMILDSRTLQSTPESGARAGYDGAKRKKGSIGDVTSPVHMAVDTLGQFLALTVTSASEQDRSQVGELTKQVSEVTGEKVKVAFVDQGYTGAEAASKAQEQGINLVVVKLPEARRGFVLLPKRWVNRTVTGPERSFAWTSRFRRLARDYERLPETLAGIHFAAFAMLMIGRILRLWLSS